MPPRRRCHLAMPQEALLDDRDLVAIAPVTTARRIRGREDFNLGSELMVGHKVGLSTDAETPSDGRHRRHTTEFGENPIKMFEEREVLADIREWKDRWGTFAKAGCRYTARISTRTPGAIRRAPPTGNLPQMMSRPGPHLL